MYNMQHRLYFTIDTTAKNKDNLFRYNSTHTCISYIYIHSFMKNHKIISKNVYFVCAVAFSIQYQNILCYKMYKKIKDFSFFPKKNKETQQITRKNM